MFFKKSSPQIVYGFKEAVDKLQAMGLDVRVRQSSAGGRTSAIVQRNGLQWIFAGDSEGFLIAREIPAPDKWDDKSILSWMNRKNFIVVVYRQEKNTFLLASHILSEGGVVMQNLARLVINFDMFIRDFLNVVDVEESQLIALE